MATANLASPQPEAVPTFAACQFPNCHPGRCRAAIRDPAHVRSKTPKITQSATCFSPGSRICTRSTRLPGMTIEGRDRCHPRSPSDSEGDSGPSGEAFSMSSSGCPSLHLSPPMPSMAPPRRGEGTVERVAPSPFCAHAFTRSRSGAPGGMQGKGRRDAQAPHQISKVGRHVGDMPSAWRAPPAPRGAAVRRTLTWSPTPAPSFVGICFLEAAAGAR